MEKTNDGLVDEIRRDLDAGYEGISAEQVRALLDAEWPVGWACRRRDDEEWRMGEVMAFREDAQSEVAAWNTDDPTYEAHVVEVIARPTDTAP